MARPIRHTGINGKRLRRLRRKKGWSQVDLAEKLGVHRMTLSRWEAGKGDPPLEVATSMSEIFGVDPDWLFEVDPEPRLARDEPSSGIRDDLLQHYPLARLQKCTKPALEAMGLTFEELTKQIELPPTRLRELLNGEKPAGHEIQYLRLVLGNDFNPIFTSPKRILAKNSRVDAEGATVEGLTTLTLKKVNLMNTRLEQVEETQLELLQKVERVETFQLDLLQKVDRILKLLSQQVADR